MSRSRPRPPKLEPGAGAAKSAPTAAPVSAEALAVRAKIAGPGDPGPGPAEFRRMIERLVAGDPRTLADAAPIPGLTAVEAWTAVDRAFGASATAAVVDPARTVDAMRRACERVRSVARAGGGIAFATARPASLLPLHLALARLARGHGAPVVELADVGPIRADGRSGRYVRWIGPVAVVSDGDTLCSTRDPRPAREWLFSIPRPALVVADGPFAQVVYERGGIEVVAFAGLDAPRLAVAAARAASGVLVPVHTDRPARAYGVLEAMTAAEPDRASGGTEAVTEGSDPEL